MRGKARMLSKGVRLPPLVAFAVSCLVPASGPAAEAEAPFEVAPGLFDPAAAELGLIRAPGSRSFTVFRPGPGEDHYANGAALVHFKGRFFAQWQSSPRDEDSADTWVAYAVSPDGETWSRPRALAPAGVGGEMRSSGGWWTDGALLVAYVNVWPGGFSSGAGGHAVYLTSEDGGTWSGPRPVLDREGRPLRGVIEQDIHAYGGRLHAAFHLQPGLLAKPHHTDDPRGLTGWTAGEMVNLPHEGTTGREIEPSLFRTADNRLVMVFRDQRSTYRQLAAESRDEGATWTTPALTAMPDSRAKQSAGNLPDGTAFLVNCPRASRERMPLALTLSRDGRVFTRSFLLRGAAELPPLREPGKYKRPGYHYPKSLATSEALYVVYATNKEDVELTRVPLPVPDAPAAAVPAAAQADR